MTTKEKAERLIELRMEFHSSNDDMWKFRDFCFAEAQEIAEAYLQLESQIEQLASFILDEVLGEPSKSEGAVECAIRIMREAKDD